MGETTIELTYTDVKKLPHTVKAVEITKELLERFKTPKKINGYEIVAGHIIDPLMNPPEKIYGLNVETLEGTHFGEIGSYLVIGIVGEVYPIRNDVFHESYTIADGTIDVPFSKEELSTLKNSVEVKKELLSEHLKTAKTSENINYLSNSMENLDNIKQKLDKYSSIRTE